MENRPKTAWMDFQRDLRVQRASSFFSDSMAVSSYQMADTWVPNMMEVKSEKSRPSNIKKSRNIIVAGGLKAEQACHSEPRHPMKWLMARNKA